MCSQQNYRVTNVLDDIRKGAEDRDTSMSSWIQRGKEQGSKYLLVVCDTFDYEYYPVYAANWDKMQEEYKRFNITNMQDVTKVIEL